MVFFEKQLLQEKDELIARLQEALLNVQESDPEGKKIRSHSFTAGEISKNQSAAGNLQILLTEPDSTPEQAQDSKKTKDGCTKISGEEYEPTSRKRKKEKECSDREKISHLATSIPGPKSPSYSIKRQERSPTKSKSPAVDPAKHKDDKRYL
ncbi:unnamed protein product [Gongylonema pulchrum]|uniref:RECQL4 n=1 Tax=Gongylonema pulchrum TaxID=637853 RepID=A0A183D6L1_9BILA|nr:unnamed protein product [Gongylonema pulchrum]